MNDDQLNQFVKNNIRISELFIENEKLLKSAVNDKIKMYI